MLDILSHSGPEAFHTFIRALKETDNGFVIKKLVDPAADESEEESEEESVIVKHVEHPGTVYDILK